MLGFKGYEWFVLIGLSLLKVGIEIGLEKKVDEKELFKFYDEFIGKHQEAQDKRLRKLEEFAILTKNYIVKGENEVSYNDYLEKVKEIKLNEFRSDLF